MTRNMLKYLALAAMLADHTAVLLLPEGGAACFILRTFGRVTAPLMCFFLAEGYFHTSSARRYAGRLLLFALLSQPAWSLAFYGRLQPVPWNMMATLLISLLALDLRMGGEILPVFKRLDERGRRFAAAGMIALSAFGDWAGIAPVWVLCFGTGVRTKKQQEKLLLLSALVIAGMDILVRMSEGRTWYGSLWDCGTVLAIPLLSSYNGQKGSSHPFHKWFCYAFYPLHFLILLWIKHIL